MPPLARLPFLSACVVAALLVAVAPSQPVGAAVASMVAVGEVTLVIGSARRIAGDGVASSVTRGMPVAIADRIETEAGGHVHVRFIDGAFVSVRPGSRLRIDDYRFDQAQPQANAVRFTLEEGVVRSITGDAARAARDRFRLNTPIAAIGVRGTDFVVLSEPETVRLTVNSGVVVMAPLGNGCIADALGPCATPFARTLSADMGRAMLEYARRAEAPRLLPLGGDKPGPDQIAPALPQEPAAGSVRGVQLEQRATTLVAEIPSSVPPGGPPASAAASVAEAPSAVPPGGPPASAAAPVAEAPSAVPAGASPASATAPESVSTQPREPSPPPVVAPTVADSPAPVPVVVPAPTPPVTPAPVPVEAAVPAQPAALVWGRYAAEPLPGDTMTVAYRANREGREVTVGNSDYVLLRRNSDQIRISPNLGQVDFALRDAQASFRDSAGAVSAAAVDGGWLRIDFNRLTFATGLQLRSDKAGTHTLSASGYVRDDGIFSSRTDAARVAGATSLDGREAGYLFERFLPIGTFSGLTIWRR